MIGQTSNSDGGDKKYTQNLWWENIVESRVLINKFEENITIDLKETGTAGGRN
jgi:hypothetical protein